MIWVMITTLGAAIARSLYSTSSTFSQAWDEFFRLRGEYRSGPPLTDEERVRLDAYMEAGALPPGWQEWDTGHGLIAAPPGWVMLRDSYALGSSVFVRLIEPEILRADLSSAAVEKVVSAERRWYDRDPFSLTVWWRSPKFDNRAGLLQLVQGKPYGVRDPMWLFHSVSPRETAWSTRSVDDVIDEYDVLREQVELRAVDGRVPAWRFSSDRDEEMEGGSSVFADLERLGVYLAKSDGDPIYIVVDEEFEDRVGLDDAVLEALGLGFTLIFLPDSLSSTYGHWYLAHPVPDVEPFYGVRPDDLAERNRLALAAQQSERIPPYAEPVLSMDRPKEVLYYWTRLFHGDLDARGWWLQIPDSYSRVRRAYIVDWLHAKEGADLSAEEAERLAVEIDGLLVEYRATAGLALPPWSER